MNTHKPFQHTQLNLKGEAMALSLYINMAQAVQLAVDYMEEEKPFGPEEIVHILGTLTTALTWMDLNGMRDRYPDLADMPDKVSPLDFKGGVEGITEWFDQQMADIKEAEEFKVTNLYN